MVQAAFCETCPPDPGIVDRHLFTGHDGLNEKRRAVMVGPCENGGEGTILSPDDVSKPTHG